MKKSSLSLAISAFVYGISSYAIAAPVSGIFEGVDQGKPNNDHQFLKNTHSNYVFNNKRLYLNQEVKNITLNINTILHVNSKGTVIDTTVNSGSEIRMEEGALSKGDLYISKGARLDIDNIDSNLTNVKVNTPAPPANISIENLNLAGTVTISPAWIGEGEDGDAPYPTKPGPYLVTKIQNLDMQSDSTIEMLAYTSGAQFNRLEIDRLSGSGNFELSTSLADNISDQIYVTGHASGNFGVLVGDSGREIIHPENVRLVYINAGDAKFDLLNKDGVVDIGIYQYRLYSKTTDGHTEWFLVGEKKEAAKQPEKNIVEPTKPAGLNDNKAIPVPFGFSVSSRNIMSMAAVSQHILNTELNTLHQRQGNIRSDDGNMNVWVRYLRDNSRLNDHRYAAFKHTMNGVLIGADKQFELTNGKLLLGGFTSYGKSNVKFNIGGNGDVNSYSGGLYATYLDQSGLYLDTVLKGNHLKNQIRAQTNSGSIGQGDNTQNAFTASLEAGYALPVYQHLTLEPYARMSYSRIGSADYKLSHGMQANIHAANSLQGELGAIFGAHLTLGSMDVMPYAKLAITREFIKDNEVTINQTLFDNNYSGNVSKYGLGVNANVTKNMSLYTELNYLNGNKVETPVNATVGFRVSF
ncbi:autotransporter outer membrane beta-barrel domain-containing protein [Xenorhabdus sp. DI]|uniref:autotransporter outer membrane beta-barrel domain-containing protein n=1 Tax=Xenorhabdus doucetiae TaxID=351671 RepID=UPI0019B104F0|nr:MULTISPECIES: autotransporter outer membrane beta-barrel domain-containing protein [unclassified Xenorhabdus]MBD2784855.1 autotransporter outer membrane beta-barrel domain-containing protein [Xenorhabdus sp. 3]MBD2787398.1 autotransporter outer membrane beta-barrel domain-containing protein [Xenorhabdus sp. DI]